MKITCPNCQKIYEIDEAKVPSGIKAAKCSACRRPIPLQQAPAETSAKPIHVINVVCQYCGQSHSLRQDEIPPAEKVINCNSCARPVPLSRASNIAPVREFKKKSSAIASEKPAIKPLESPGLVNDLIRFRCDGCGKKYKFNRNKIPPNVQAIKCRVCGHKTRLPHKEAIERADDPIQPNAHHEKIPPSKPNLVPDETPLLVSPPRKKKWLYAAAACVLLASILGVLAHLNIVRLDELKQYIPGKAEKLDELSPLLNKDPFLVLNLNVPFILKALENHLESDKKTVGFQELMSMMQSMALSQLELYLYSAPNSRLLPVIVAHGSNRQQMEKVFNSHKSFQEYFTRKPSGTYRLKKEAISDAEKYQLPREPYQLTLIDSGAVLAPVSFSAAIKESPRLLKKSRVAKFAQTIGKRQDLAVIAIKVPENIIQGWEEKIQSHPAVQVNPQTAMMASMGTSIISQLADSLKPVDVLALAFRFPGENKRALSYAQQFRPGVDGEKIYRQLTAANSADYEISGIIKNLILLFHDQHYQHTLDFKNNRLALEFSWSKKDDEAFITALTKATVGQLFAGSMDLPPAPGKVQTRYATEPNFVVHVNPDQLKKTIPQLIKDSLFPGHYWNREDTPRMTLDLDPIDLPNTKLAEMTYEVKSIRSPDGRDIMGVEESKIKSRIQLGNLYPGNISLNIKAGTPPDDLAKASIFFDLTVPVALEVLGFDAEDQPGSVKEAAGIRVTLVRLEKDVAQVSGSGGKSMQLIAYDHTGKALASRESMSTPSSISTRFEGIISSLKVVVTRNILESSFEIEVDLNQGKELVLSHEPEVPERKRFNLHPIPVYANFTADDLKNLSVVWTEGQERSWTDSLSIKLPQGPFSGYAVWEVHFFGPDKPRLFNGSAAQSTREFSFTLEKDKLKQANAAFGKVHLNLHTDISRLVFAPKNGSNPAPQVLSGNTVSVEFNKNEITYSAGQADVIQTVAYDARGKRLKQDQYTRNNGGKRAIYFWGVPAKFEMDVAVNTLEEVIPFEIRQRPLDEKAYQAFKRTIKNHREVVKTIKTIDRARRKDRSYYGDDLAGLFYLYAGNQKKPQNLITQEIAHSDPAGQERFGYKVRPYKGYYFTVLSGVEKSGVKKDYNRRSKKSRYTWQKGTITTTSLTRHPDLVAIPEDKSQPTFFLQWGQVYMKPLSGEELRYLPDGYYNKGWVEARYIDN
jgi:predicted Zn finger-like uncharacterized protein